MFTEISWNSYLTIVIVLLAVYYVFIGLLYYSSNIVGLLSGKKFTQRDTLTSVVGMDTLTEKKNLFQTAHSLSDEIQAYLNEAGRNSLNKEDVVQSLKVMLAKYPVIKDLPFRDVIQNLIRTEAETYCFIHLSEEEINELWN